MDEEVGDVYQAMQFRLNCGLTEYKAQYSLVC